MVLTIYAVQLRTTDGPVVNMRHYRFHNDAENEAKRLNDAVGVGGVARILRPYVKEIVTVEVEVY